MTVTPARDALNHISQDVKVVRDEMVKGRRGGPRDEAAADLDSALAAILEAVLDAQDAYARLHAR